MLFWPLQYSWDHQLRLQVSELVGETATTTTVVATHTEATVITVSRIHVTTATTVLDLILDTGQTMGLILRLDTVVRTMIRAITIIILQVSRGIVDIWITRQVIMIFINQGTGIKKLQPL